MLPAASVWRTITDLAPSPLSVKLLPLPVVQLVPPLVLYCHVAPASSPATLTVPTLVMLSAATPLSLARVMVGAEGGVVSGVTAGAFELAGVAPPLLAIAASTTPPPSAPSAPSSPEPALMDAVGL